MTVRALTRRLAMTLAALVALTTGAFAQLGSQRVGTSAATFLKIGVGARPAAMGQSTVALLADPVNLFHNPAGIAGVRKRAIVLERISWVADVDVTAAGFTSELPFGGVGGLSLMTLAVDMDETTELNPEGTGRRFSHRDLAIGGSYARYLTDRFAFGVTARLVYEALGTEIGGPSATAMMVDLGTSFETGYRNVVLAMAIQNFGPDLKPGGGYVDPREFSNGTVVEYSGFAPPTTFRLGASYLVWTAQGIGVEIMSEFLKPADNDETARVGAELELAQGLLYLRGGYDGGSDALPWSGGLGVRLKGDKLATRLDYAFSQSEFFDRVDRLSFRLDF